MDKLHPVDIQDIVEAYACILSELAVTESCITFLAFLGSFLDRINKTEDMSNALGRD
jgi:hypothetical protein